MPLRTFSADVEACSAIDAASFAAPGWDLNEELSRPYARIWAARRNDVVHGFLLAWHTADELVVLSIAVSPGARRLGVGRALVRAAIAYAAAAGARGIFLDVRRSNTAARALYGAAGFVELAVRRGYYADTNEDAMELGLFFDADGAIDRRAP